MHHRHRHPLAGGDRAFHDLPLAAHPKLDLTTDFAVLSIAPTLRGQATAIEIVGDSPLPEVAIHAEGGVTSVRITNPRDTGDEPPRSRNWWDKRRWQKNFPAQIIVHAPRDLVARIRPSTAYVHVEHLEDCELDIHADAGAIHLEDVSGRLILETEAGRIDGTGLAGSIHASTSAGALRLDILHLDPGRHRVRTTMGAAILELARGLPVQIDTRTAMGSSRVDAVSTRGAEALLAVEADLGAIRIHESRRTWAPRPRPRSRPAENDGPLPTPSLEASAPGDDEAIERILASVANGSLSPTDARELLRSMGWA